MISDSLFLVTAALAAITRLILPTVDGVSIKWITTQAVGKIYYMVSSKSICEDKIRMDYNYDSEHISESPHTHMVELNTSRNGVPMSEKQMKVCILPKLKQAVLTKVSNLHRFKQITRINIMNGIKIGQMHI